MLVSPFLMSASFTLRRLLVVCCSFSAWILGQNPWTGNGSERLGSCVLQEGAAGSPLAKCRFSASSH